MSDNKRNQVSFDFANSPELKAIFQGWDLGKSYELGVKFQLNTMDDAGATGTIEQVTVEDEEKETVEPDAQNPVMIVMKAGPSKTKTPESEAMPAEMAGAEPVPYS